MKSLLAFCLIFIGLTFSHAKDFPLPKGTKFVFPKGLTIKVEWLVPFNANYEKKEGHKITFDLDDKGEPWLGIEGKYLLNPLKRKLFQVSTPFQDFLFMPDGEFVVATEEALGILIHNNKSNDLIFLPIMSLPNGEIKLILGSDRSLIILLFDPEKRISQVYQLKGNENKGEILKIIEMRDKIQDVCMFKESLYLAINKIIIKVSLKSRQMNHLFSLRAPITEIECFGEDQIIYATNNRLGFFNGNKCIEFAQISNSTIRLKNKLLYILMKDTLGIIRIDSLEYLNSYK